MSKREVQKSLNRLTKTGFSLDDDQATNWLATNLSKIKTGMRQSTFIDSSKTLAKNKSIKPGIMAFFGYNPKTKDDLPFWDEFPVVIILCPKGAGFLGLNLHYLPPAARAMFLNRLIDYVNDKNWATNPRADALFKITYGMLKSDPKLIKYKKCIKRYYYSNIVSKVAFIPQTEWKAVPFFPLDRFKGMPKKDIWRLA
jgi:hypothetical protein